MQEDSLSHVDFSNAHEVFQHLYSTEGAEKAFNASYSERQKSNFSNIKEFTYGEIDFHTFIDLMNRVSPKKGEVFYDLGCGAGKALVVAALSYPFSAVRGVELLKGLYDISKGVCDRMQSSAKYVEKPSVEVINNNFFEVDFFDADIIYISSTCFGEETMQRLEEKFLGLKENARIILLTRELKSPSFELLYKNSCKMSWGMCTARIYCKK